MAGLTQELINTRWSLDEDSLQLSFTLPQVEWRSRNFHLQFTFLFSGRHYRFHLTTVLGEKQGPTHQRLWSPFLTVSRPANTPSAPSDIVQYLTGNTAVFLGLLLGGDKGVQTGLSINSPRRKAYCLLDMVQCFPLQSSPAFSAGHLSSRAFLVRQSCSPGHTGFKTRPLLLINLEDDCLFLGVMFSNLCFNLKCG